MLRQLADWLHFTHIVLFIKSKIQFFESKSQQGVADTRRNAGCLSSQRYNFLKANHNSFSCILFFLLVVYQVKDTIFWKQITTNKRGVHQWHRLFIKSKIQFFESKSQHCPAAKFFCFGCLSSQRYNFLKANHNKGMNLIVKEVVVYQVKDTIFWKQITTQLGTYKFEGMLFIKSKIQFFESKSQKSQYIN